MPWTLLFIVAFFTVTFFLVLFPIRDCPVSEWDEKEKRRREIIREVAKHG